MPNITRNFINLPPSQHLQNFRFTGERIPYPDKGVKGDSFPMTWGADDHLHTSAGDPSWGESPYGLDTERFVGGPTDYKIEKTDIMREYDGFGGNGPKPTGMISVGGILYLAVQNMLRAKEPPFSRGCQHGSDAHIIYSSIGGYFWAPAKENIKETDIMFPGSAFGGPAFINFGKDNANARDGFVYAVSVDQWDNGSNLRLGRVPADKIPHRGSWEWVAAFTPGEPGRPLGEPVWHPDLANAIPILSRHRCLSTPEMLYVASIRRYLLLTWCLHRDFDPDAGSDLIILDAPEPWGPFTLVHIEENWESQAFNPYCPRIPLKWLEATRESGTSDGKMATQNAAQPLAAGEPLPKALNGWLQFSGSWGTYGQHEDRLFYRSNVRPFAVDVVGA